MLSSHPRPKSQPPLKFKQMIAQDRNEEADENWNQIIDRYKEEADNTNRELEELSSPTLSSSSSSSLASSEISLSTNSSTSTVLAALNSLQHPQIASTECNHSSKSMIARYSATAKKSHPTIRAIQQVVCDGLEKSEEEDDETNQALSSSSSTSSTSSSSGLSSMNSVSNNSQEGLSLVSSQQQILATRNNSNNCENDEIEVKLCLDQLIDSVVDQADNEIEYKTFQLHEAILAQTTSGTSGSSSDESGSPTQLLKQQQSQQSVDTRPIRGYSKHIDADADEVYLIRRFKINEPLTDSLILHLSRQCISQALKQQKHGPHEDPWFVAMRLKKGTIEWYQSRSKLSFESVGIEKITNCLVQQQLVVWLIDHNKNNHNNNHNHSREELETTLDDIALALDEPIGQCNTEVLSETSQPTAVQQIRFNNSEIEAVVWLCKSEEKAICFRELFRSIEEKRQLNKENAYDSNNNRDNDQQIFGSKGIDDRSMELVETTTNDLVSANQFNHHQQQLQVKAMSVLSDSSNRKVQRQQKKASKEKVNVASTSIAIANNHQQPPKIAVIENRQQQVETPVFSSYANNDKMNVATSDHKAAMTIKKPSSIGIDSLSQQQTSGLTSYYKDVANKVINNGQSKIRNLKGEVIKLNNRTSSSPASSSKRISLVVSHSESNRPSSSSSSNVLNQQIGGSKLNSSSSVRNPAQQDDNKTKSSLDSRDNFDDQRRLISKSISNLPLVTTQNYGIKSLIESNHQQTIPTVKPRTSILKNKQQTNGCDNNNNSISNNSNIVTDGQNTHQIMKRRSFNQDSGLADSDTEQNKRREIANKPKSILKTSKSVSNIVIEEQQCFSKYKQEENIKQQQKSETWKAYAQQQQKLPSKRNDIDKRRSTYSMISEPTNFESSNTYHFDQEGENEYDYDRREQTFERLRQRASCYDISRLMSKNGLQSQLNKLRSGSTNSVTSKSRQRRPALLLDGTDKQPDQITVKSDKHSKDKCQNKDSRVADECETSRFAPIIKTTTSGPDGMVHAKVNDYQSKPSMNRLSNSSQGGRRQQQHQSRSSVVIKTLEGGSNPRNASKNSEFDPRSLKRLPVSSTSYQEDELDTDRTSKANVNNNKSSVTSIRVNGNFSSREETSKDANKQIEQNKRAQNNAARKEVKQDVVSSGSSSNEESSTEDESLRPLASSSLSKSGPFSLLRQSFNQKTLSSMLKFSGRASLRIKQPPNEPANEVALSSDKSSAIAIAEANLLAAKQLKHQAQKLKEQQKRDQQQHLDPSFMLAAVQYNQQIQRQQQHQIMYQQYAIASRNQMLDASSVHMQHQMLIQRQQQQQHQQQLAYIANLNSTHYLAQQMAVLPPQAPMIQMPTMAAQQLMYVQSNPMQQMQAQQVPPPSSGFFKKSILKGNNKIMQSPSAMMYHHNTTNQQQQQQQQLIPMAVNHHSSFNIVYGASASQASQIPQMQQQQHQGNQIHEKEQDSSLRKHSSLGASMRKTVKSILINRSSFKSAAINNSQDANVKSSIEVKKPELKLKSALKTSSSRDLVLNSEGSDGDGSSSDSTTVGGGQVNSVKSSSKSQLSRVPKSVLKKTLDHREMLSSSSSDSSCSSANGNEYGDSQLDNNNTNAIDYTQGVILYTGDSDQFQKNSTLRASKQKAVSSNSRKNVTFSTKLTSIL